MNKTLLFAIGGAISLIALITIFSSNEFDDMQNLSIDKETPPHTQSKQLVSSKKEVVIDYKTTQRTDESPIKELSKKAKRLKLDAVTEAKTLDRSGTFEVAIINPNKDATKATGAYTTLQGDIDGKPFSLKIPQHLIDEGTGATELRITNRKTGEVSSVPAVFIDDMKDPAHKQYISADSKDLQNFQQRSHEVVAPLLPGERRE